MAFAERRELKDWVSIYYTGNDWKLVNTFEVHTVDLSDLMWCKQDSAILVWDTPLENTVIVYSAMTGEVLARHHPSTTPGGLGIKQVSQSPNSNFMVAALFDTKMKLYNGVSFKDIA